ncbi:protein FLX-like 2 isoform X1 [Salvia splendens]|uniref:protein FLX-like 2 isoform X1 n=1 Tax=Salvia splendens TaxID=180675 RepID=UPI001C268331|nr:protein FLX-like 2 isoform X1 [Salvia splendens]XP_042025249.1 protein FLX-like 2 isoform X1 [Salvia splendens]XP_042025250.1 protein FLX-like 2 isoform X1 [Salvia splendens]XP_042025251.1 protein FLX-like 2 isoform X1 [Salvia splendens]XP_042025252.1 protein FLX-like 2 isoform X1 [Salvia splendens]XP_042025253.1 protein FLX-like 2 isoform X1 [Salvia splendens]XP_042025254.1 protein FLX-like 2 isoform X1 [Salvia splendens]XP_042025255.1 protein FLX-like 2 isoform X1 [Salvia splendens]
MASKGRVPPPHHHRPLPGPGAGHPDPYASAVRPPVGGFPHFEMLPPHELMAHKLSAQHVEIAKLATENQRLAATHGTLRQDLATAKHELQLIHAHINDVKSEKEQQTRGITDTISKMESELKAAESIKKELQQTRTEAQSLVSGRQELVSKIQQLNHELHMAHSEAQQIPPLVAELDGMRQEYQHYRGTYDYEKKLYNDHLESLQVMEKNYIAMSREVEKLRAELSTSTNYDHRTGGPYGGSAGYIGNVPPGNYASGHAYGVQQQGHGSHLGGGAGLGPAVPAGTEGNSQPAPYGSGNAQDASRGPFYPAFRGTSYDPQRVQTGASYGAQLGPTGTGYGAQLGPTGTGYDAQRGLAPSAHNAPRVPGYEAPRGHRSETQEGQGAPAYDIQRGSGDEAQRGANYETQKGAIYDASSRGPAVHQGQVSMNNQPYQPTPNSRAGTGYEVPSHGVNPAHR